MRMRKKEKDIYIQYLDFYDKIFDEDIKTLKQLKRYLIKCIEIAYNKKVTENKPEMMIYEKERHDIEVYWEGYFKKVLIELKHIYGNAKELCRQYKKENKEIKYRKMIDESIEKSNKATAHYLTMDFRYKYNMYTIRILDTIIDIYYDMGKNKFFTKKHKIKGDLYDIKKDKKVFL